MPYRPIKIAGFESGLIQEREDFLLPNDGFPTLFNSYVWREKIKRKQGLQNIGRLRRVLTGLATTTGASPWSFNIYIVFPTLLGSFSKEIDHGSVVIRINAGTEVFTDGGDGTFSSNFGGTGTINYITGAVTLTHSQGAAAPVSVALNYFPSFPVMGLKLREKGAINNEEYIAFDTTYAYAFVSSNWQELVTGTTWSGSDSDFFWTTNFYTNAANQKLFWATNFANSAGSPMRYYDGTVWTTFEPLIDSTEKLLSANVLLPFRGRMVSLNTREGTVLGGANVQYPQRIRWAAIGSPIQADAWREDIRGKGSYLDIPTSQNIVSAGFVRDNLVVYCERSTWQLRYTGNVIQPFQIERVNSELGVESTFSSVQFDTSLVGIGDKGIVECDSFKSTRIDQKIPDFAYQINSESEGQKRVSGVRDFRNRLAYWAYPDKASLKDDQYFPNRRLLFNYENGSWAIFRDSITALGLLQESVDRTWIDPDDQWSESNYAWVENINLTPELAGGNQQGYTFFLNKKTLNDESLTINSITGNTTTPTSIRCYDHGLEDEEIVEFSGITGTFSSLNGIRFAIKYFDKDNFFIFKYDTETLLFNDPQLNAPASDYIGGGKVALIDNFEIVSKKFNYFDEGRRILIGFIDFLMSTTTAGSITLEIREDYNPITLNNPSGDLFFNTTIPTSSLDPSDGSTKTFQRVFCKTRGSFLTLVLKLSNEQMNGQEASSDVQVDGVILWQRAAENQLYTGEIR